VGSGHDFWLDTCSADHVVLYSWGGSVHNTENHARNPKHRHEDEAPLCAYMFVRALFDQLLPGCKLTRKEWLRWLIGGSPFLAQNFPKFDDLCQSINIMHNSVLIRSNFK
jgi:hypothetical protein